MSSNDRYILYVDDERANRIVFEQSFKDRFSIKTVSTAEDALNFLKTEPVAVLVTDQRMPGMSGNDLLLRAKELHPEVVRIVITAYSDLEPILRAVNEGIVARYLVKPWDFAELDEILRWAVEAHAAGQQSSALQLRLMQTERLVTLGSIAGTIVHDINGPLSYLHANTERMIGLSSAVPALAGLLERHGQELGERDREALGDVVAELPEILDDMRHGCTVIGALTEGLRRMMRTMPPSDELPSAEPLPIIRYALSVCRRIALDSGAEMLYDGPTALPKVRINPPELTQILINLISNAAQAVGTVDRSDRRVVVNAIEAGDKLRFIISDNGPGMSPEVLKKIGTLFFTTREEGTGLGVAQCKRLVQRAAGDIHFVSSEGAGTTVTVLLARA